MTMVSLPPQKLAKYNRLIIKWDRIITDYVSKSII